MKHGKHYWNELVKQLVNTCGMIHVSLVSFLTQCNVNTRVIIVLMTAFCIATLLYSTINKSHTYTIIIFGKLCIFMKMLVS